LSHSVQTERPAHLQNEQIYSKLRVDTLVAQFAFEAEMKIRTFDLDLDYEDVQTLWRACAPGIQISSTDDYAGLLHKMERDPQLFLVAVDRGQIIGTVIGGYDGRRGIVYHLAVAPDQRREGIARRLMDTVEDRLKALGCYKYYLLVTRENEEALAFYESIGCEPMELHILGKVIA
jgi:ribosomal protein S18 acetylase RimI-like enzyme